MTFAYQIATLFFQAACNPEFELESSHTVKGQGRYLLPHVTDPLVNHLWLCQSLIKTNDSAQCTKSALPYSLRPLTALTFVLLIQLTRGLK